MNNGESSYRRFLEGDDEGIVEIIRDYKDGLILYINSYVNNIFTAEELMEETFFKLVIKKPRFVGRNSFKTWLYTIGRNLAIDYIRSNDRFTDNPIEDFENYLSEEQSIEKAYLRKEDKIILHRALQRLSPEYRQVLYLKYFEDFSNPEISKIMKKSKHQLENLVYRARNSLKAELDKEDFVYEGL